MYLGSNIWNTRLEGRGSPVLVKTGPNNTRHIVWALGKFLFFYFKFVTQTNDDPQKPMQANEDPQKPLQASKDQWQPAQANEGLCKPMQDNEGHESQQKWAQMMPDVSFGLYVSFFFLQ